MKPTSSQEANILSLLRTVLTLAGSYVAGHAFMGIQVDSSIWEEVIGSVVAVVSTVWGIVDKTATIDAVQSAVRSVIISIGGIFVAHGKLSEETLTQILGLALAIIPFMQSWTAKIKGKQVAAGSIVPSASTGKFVTQEPPKPDQNSKP